MSPCKFPKAVAYIRGSGEYPRLQGIVKFYQECGGTLVMAEVCGLPQKDGFFAFHIHEGLNCRGEGFPDTGSHYNPTGAIHPYHAGDLPPLLSNNGKARMTVLTDRFRVEEIIGRTVLIHSEPDDFRSQPSGNAGAKIACGVIRRA